MALQIGGKYSIDEITETDFKNAAKEVGLGEKLAMKQFSELCGSFENALKEAAYVLAQSGFKKAPSIRDSILRTGGFSRL